MKITSSSIYQLAQHIVSELKKIGVFFRGRTVSPLEKSENYIPKHDQSKHFVPRQFVRNCTPNSIKAILLELGNHHGVMIDDNLLDNYTRYFCPRANTNKMIEEAMEKVAIKPTFMFPEGSLVKSLKENNIELAIAVQSSTQHAYPIILVKKDGQEQYMTINQKGIPLRSADYQNLEDAMDVHYYAIRPTSADHSNSNYASLVPEIDDMEDDFTRLYSMKRLIV